MKSNCRALKLSILISVVSLLVIIFFAILSFNFENKIIELIINIFLGLFSSGVVTFLMAIPAYKTSKNKLLKEFWQEVFYLLNQFSNIQFLFCEFKQENVISYLDELKNIKWKKEFNKISKEKVPIKKEIYKNILINEFINHRPILLSQISKQTMENYADEYINNNNIRKMRVDAKKIYEEYLKLSNESTLKLNFMLEDMEFFINRKKFIKMQNDIYYPIYNILNIIKENCFHFRLFLNGEGNEINALNKLFKLQDELFEVKITESKEFITYTIINKFLYKILFNAEQIQKNIYDADLKKSFMIHSEHRLHK